MKRVVVVSVFLVFLVGSVSECSAEMPFARYVKNRWNDFLDLFIVQAAVPQKHYAWGAHLRLSDLLQLGQVHFDGVKAGLDGRALITAQEQKDQSSLLFFESKTEINQDLLWSLPDQEQWRGRPIIRNGLYEFNDGRAMPWSLGLEVMIPPCFGGFEIGISPCQMGDFLFGLLALDPWGDDIPKPIDEEIAQMSGIGAAEKEPAQSKEFVLQR